MIITTMYSILIIFYLFIHAEFASQLPHDGGTFYTNDTMESSRPHYAASWPPILQAAALWINTVDFKSNLIPCGETNNNNAANNNQLENESDKFHLLFGK